MNFSLNIIKIYWTELNWKKSVSAILKLCMYCMGMNIVAMISDWKHSLWKVVLNALWNPFYNDEQKYYVRWFVTDLTGNSFLRLAKILGKCHPRDRTYMLLNGKVNQNANGNNYVPVGKRIDKYAQGVLEDCFGLYSKNLSYKNDQLICITQPWSHYPHIIYYLCKMNLFWASTNQLVVAWQQTGFHPNR